MLKGARERKGVVLAATPFLPMVNFKNKAPSLSWQRAQVTKAAFKQSLKQSNPGNLKNHSSSHSVGMGNCHQTHREGDVLTGAI
jgi:hypothetical protein